MLTLTRPQRQSLATLLIVVLTVAPTAWVAGWAWWVRQPGHVREVEAELTQALGLAVEIKAVRHPGPCEDRLDGLVLRIEEPGGQSPTLTEVLSAESARVVRRKGRWLVDLDGLRLFGADPTAALARLQTLARHLGKLSARADVVARTGTVELGRGLGRVSLRFHDLAANLQKADGREQVSSSFRLDAGDDSPRCELQLEAVQKSDGPRLSLSLQTMDGPIPARVLNPLFDASGWLGDDARMSGTLRIGRRRDRPFSARFEGELLDVDLACLVQAHFPSQSLSGRADISIRSASWDLLPGDRISGWTSAEGRIVSGPGRIGDSLLRALSEQMRFSVEPELLSRAEPADVPFQSLGLDFSLDESGEIELEGALGAGVPPGAVIVPVDRLHPLAYAPDGSANVRGLWKTLVPASDDVLVPATRASQVLHHLPLPPSSTAAASAQRAN